MKMQTTPQTINLQLIWIKSRKSNEIATGKLIHEELSYNI